MPAKSVVTIAMALLAGVSLTTAALGDIVPPRPGQPDEPTKERTIPKPRDEQKSPPKPVDDRKPPVRAERDGEAPSAPWHLIAAAFAASAVTALFYFRSKPTA